MVIGLFAPLATSEAMAAVVSPEQAMMKAAQQPFDRDTTDFDRVVLVGDFQHQVGCGDWDTNCDQTRLVNINGFWTGVFGVAPGNWNWELIAIDRFGTQYAIDDSQVSVAEGQTGIYAEFDSASRDNNVSAVTGIAYANGMFGDVALAQDGDGYIATALNIANPGWMDFQVTVNGQQIQTGADFQQGVNRVSFDGVGNISNVEHRGYAEVVVQRMDPDGNPLSGSCFVLDGQNQTRGCDTDGSQDGSGDGVTTLRFSSGFQPGDYTLRETRAADGAEQLSDQTINLQPGQSVIEARSEGEPTPETGDLSVYRYDQDFNPVAGACFELANMNGEIVGDACDDGAGRTDFQGVPAGDYNLFETRTPENVEPAQSAFVTVNPGQLTEINVQSNAIVVEGPPVDEPPVDDDPIDEVPPIDEPPVDDVPIDTPEETRFGRIIIYREDDFGTRLGAACYEAVDASGNVVAAFCDEDGFTADDGVTGLPDLPVGDYTVIESRTPTGYEPAQPVQLTVIEGDVEHTIRTAAVSVVEEPPADDPQDDEPVSDDGQLSPLDADGPNATLVVNYEFVDGQPAACVEVDTPSTGGGAIIGIDIALPYACDNDGQRDSNPELGVIELRSLTPGEFEVVAYEGPDYILQADPIPVTLVNDETVTVTFERPAPVTTSFTIQTLDGETPVAGACYVINEGGDWFCHEGDPNVPLTISNVNPGDVSVRMVQAPGGYNLADPDSQQVNIAADGSTNVVFNVSRTTTSFTIQTLDGETPVAGACYVINEGGDWFCHEGDPNVPLTISNVNPGDVSVRMVQAPSGYNLADPDSQLVNIAADGSTNVVFNVTRSTTSFTIQTLDGETPVSGACYTINEGGDWFCHEGDPNVPLTISNVNPGDVSVRMVQAPGGYDLADPDSQLVNIAADGSTNVVFNVTRSTTSFTIQTLDGETPVAGACYVINEGGDWFCHEGDPNVPLTISNINPGDVTVRMVQAPGGYNLADPDSQLVNIAADGSTSVMFNVSRVTVPLTINTTDGSAPVGGACFLLDDATEFCDDGSGTHTLTVSPGDHSVTMTSAPAGFDLPDPATQSVTANAGETPAVTFTLARSTAALNVNTSDGTSNVAGACYTLNEQGVQLCDDGSGVTFGNVVPGDYTVTIDSVPETHVLTSESTLPVSVGAEGSTVTFNVELATVNVTVSTVDSETGETLTGACYTLDDGEIVCDDDESGEVLFENQTPGEKTLSMERAPEGFDPSADQVIQTTDGNVEVGVLETTGAVLVYVLHTDDTLIENACVVLGDAEPSEDCLTDETGLVSYANVPITTQNVTFISAPGGFVLADGQDATKALVFEEGQAVVEYRVQDAPPTTGGLEVTVQIAGETPQIVPGACVSIDHVESDFTADGCAGDDGVVRFADLPVGGYSVDLDVDQYVGPAIEPVTPVSATVEAGVANTATLNLQLAPTTGTLQITTLSGDILIEGACYTVAGTEEVCDGDTDDIHNTPGIVTISDLAPGENISVVMSHTPDGYQEPAAQQVDIIVGETTEVTFSLIATVLPGTVTVQTVDQGDNLLNGACYRLQQGNSVIQTGCDTDPADGEVIFTDLPAGAYQLVQTRTPDGGPFDLAQARPVDVTAGGNTVVEVRMSLQPGSLVITTVDAEDLSVVLENACYELLRDGSVVFGPFCDAADTQGVDGRVRFGNVPAGEYTLRQTQTAPGFETAADRTITISAGVNRQITVENARILPPAETGTLVVIPLAPNGQAVPGGCYQVFDGSTPVSNRICDNADDQPARITFQNLPTGELTLRETLAPSPDWQIAPDITVTIRNNETTTVEVPHQFKRGHVVIQAVNSVGLPLQGACFTLTEAGDTELCTNSSGQATVTGLEPGTRELTQTKAPFGFKLDETPREVIVRPGQTTTVRVVFENEPPPNTGTVQVQKFFCPAGDEGERTRFLGGAQGNQELQHTAGCNPGIATFTLVAEDGSTESNAEFSTNEEGRAQLTAVAGIYLLTETDPDLPGNSAARIRVGVGQMTTVIVINYVAPPAPAPVTINVEGYTCAPGFNGSSFVDFANSCMAESQLTNQITVRAEAANRFKRITGDTGVLGKTTFNELPAGTYSIWSQRPHNIPVTYLFCGADVNNPSHKAVNGSVSIALESGTTILCRVFQVPPLFDAEHGAIQVHKFNCPINERQRGFDWENECERPSEPIAFEIVQLAKTDGTPPQPVRLSTNADGIVQFPMLVPGTYKLTEVEGEWCFAQSNSVDAQGNVVVQKNKLSEVWVYNCVGTKAPPNTGSGDAAGVFGPDGGISPVQVLPNLIWPVVLFAGWMILRDRKQA